MKNEAFAEQPSFGSEHPQPRRAKALRIALLGYRSHPQVGGQGIYLKYLSRALAQLGHKVDVFSGPPYPELDPGIGLIKVPSLDLYSHFPHHIRAFRWRFLRSWTDFYEWWAMASGGFAEPYCFGRRLLQCLNPSDYDIVHDNQTLAYGLLQLQNRGALLVTTIHHPITRDLQLALSQESRWGHRALLKRWYSFLTMQKKVARQLRHIVTVSNTSKRDIQAAFHCSEQVIRVVPNGVDQQVFRPLSDVNKRRHRLITTTSSDQPLKGFRSLLQALAIVREQIPDIHLRVIGKLQPGGANERLIATLELQNHISFRAQLTDSELCQEYAKAQLAVCPSLYEGFGLPAIEAMACGVALISSDGGALSEVVGDGGKLYSAGDAAALAEAMLELLHNPLLAQHYRQKGLHRVSNHYCWTKVAEQMAAYYRELLLEPMQLCKP